jgi:cohesin loading factor subunit SCC2
LIDARIVLSLKHFVRLRDGRSIHIVSALLLQLIQTTAHDVRVQATKLSSARRTRKITHQKSDTALPEILPNESEPSESDYEVNFIQRHDVDFTLTLFIPKEIQLYISGLDSAHRLTKGILMFLTKR